MLYSSLKNILDMGMLHFINMLTGRIYYVNSDDHIFLFQTSLYNLMMDLSVWYFHKFSTRPGMDKIAYMFAAYWSNYLVCLK